MFFSSTQELHHQRSIGQFKAIEETLALFLKLWKDYAWWKIVLPIDKKWLKNTERNPNSMTISKKSNGRL